MLDNDEEFDENPPLPSIEWHKRMLKRRLKKVIVGIDVGGTRTRVAIMQPKKDAANEFEPVVVEDIPSVVSFLSGGPCLVGGYAEKRKLTSPLNTFYATKRLTGRRYIDPLTKEMTDRVGYDIYESPNGHTRLMSTNRFRIFSPAEIEALLILKVKELCATRWKISAEKVVLTVPPYFNDFQTEITRSVGSLAGVNVVDIISTPIAAVLAYSSVSNTVEASKNTVVYDFGGSTFNVSVLKICEGVTYPEVISTVEDLLLGGENFDFAIVDYFVSELQRITKVNPRLSPILMQRLKESAENAKRELTIYTEVEVKFGTVSVHVPTLTKEIDDVILKFTRTKFEELVADLIERTVSLCHKALKKAKMTVSDVDEVLAIGGTCRIPKVKATIEGIFGKPPVAIQSENIDRANAVAIGAVIRCHDLRCIASDDPPRSPAPPINIPIPVRETAEFCFEVSDNELDVEPITKNFMKAGVWGLHTENQADSYVISRNLLPPIQLMVSEGVYFIYLYRGYMKWIREIEERPDESVEVLISYLRLKKEMFVEEELSRLLPLPYFPDTFSFFI